MYLTKDWNLYLVSTQCTWIHLITKDVVSQWNIEDSKDVAQFVIAVLSVKVEEASFGEYESMIISIIVILSWIYCLKYREVLLFLTVPNKFTPSFKLTFFPPVR